MFLRALQPPLAELLPLPPLPPCPEASTSAPSCASCEGKDPSSLAPGLQAAPVDECAGKPSAALPCREVW